MYLKSLMNHLASRAHYWLPVDELLILIQDGEQKGWRHFPEDVNLSKSPLHPLIEQAIEAHQVTPHRHDHVIVAPVVIDDNVIGAVAVSAADENELVAHHTYLVQSLAEQLALGIQLETSQNRVKETHGSVEAARQELEIYRDLAQFSTSGERLESLLPQMAERLTTLFEADACAITLWDAENMNVQRLAVWGVDEEQFFSHHHRPDVPSLTAQIVKNKQPLFLLSSDEEAEQFEPVFRDYGINAMVALPLIAHGNVIGVAFLMRRSEDMPFERDQVAEVSPSLSHLVLVIYNQMLFTEINERLIQTETLQRIVAITAATIDLDEMLTIAVMEVANVLNAEGAQLLIADNERQLLIPHESSLYGVAREWDTEGWKFSDSGHQVEVFHNDAPYLSNNPSTTLAIPRRNILSVPLTTRQKTLGVLSIANRRDGNFTPAHGNMALAIAGQIATSMENLQLFAAERRRADRMLTINQISQQLTSTLELSRLMREVVTSVHETFNYEVVYIYLLDDDKRNLVCRGSAVSDPAQYVEEGFSFSINEGITGRAVRSNESQLIPDLSEDPDYLALANPGAVKSGLVVTLRHGDSTLGALVIGSSKVNDFNEIDRVSLENLAAQVSIAMDNAWLYSQTQRRLLEQGIVHQIGQDLIAILDYNELVFAIARHMARALNTSMCLVSIYDSDEDMLRIEAEYWSQEMKKNRQGASSWKLGESYPVGQFPLAIRAIQSGYPVVAHIDDADTSPEHQAMLKESGNQSVMVVPMVMGKQVLGMVSWIEKQQSRRFSLDDERLGQTLVSQAAIALENARLYREAELRLGQLEQIQAASRSISSELIMQSLLDRVVKEAAAIFEVEAVAVLASDEIGLRFVVQAAYGLSAEFIKAHYVVITPEMRDKTPEEFQPTYIRDFKGALDTKKLPIIRAENIHSALLIPLHKGTNLMGQIEFYSKDHVRVFSEVDVEFARLLASQAAVAMDNAVLFLELEKHAQELAKANALKTQFLANISHELRTPMNSILGFSETLLGGIYGELNEEQQSRLERILRNGRNLLKLIDDLLDISKIDAGRMEIQIEPVNLTDELNKILNTVENLAHSRGLYLTVTMPEDMPPIMADTLRLRQIINNLVGNAVKFTKEGGVTITAEVKEEVALNPKPGEKDSREVVWVSVEDTGIGLELEHQLVIFDEFRQADGSTTREYGGTGLGLAICSRLIELMKGRIWVDSEVGKGSVFTFVLPTARD